MGVKDVPMKEEKLLSKNLLKKIIDKKELEEALCHPSNLLRYNPNNDKFYLRITDNNKVDPKASVFFEYAGKEKLHVDQKYTVIENFTEIYEPALKFLHDNGIKFKDIQVYEKKRGLSGEEFFKNRFGTASTWCKN